MAYDPSSHTVILHGGARTNPSLIYFPDTWSWDGTAWQQISVVAPPDRDWLSLSTDTTTGHPILFGGLHSPPTESLNDAWRWTGSAWDLVHTTSRPLARGTHAAAFNPDRGRLLIFGGVAVGAGTQLFGDTWELNGSFWTELSTTGPEPRQHAGMVYDAARQQTVLFGGSTLSTPLGDTWVWVPDRACRADANCDDNVNIADFLAYLQFFAAADPRADVNHNGQVNLTDFLAYLAFFAAGC
jgi:hypothetical protein